MPTRKRRGRGRAEARVRKRSLRVLNLKGLKKIWRRGLPRIPRVTKVRRVPKVTNVPRLAKVPTRTLRKRWPMVTVIWYLHPPWLARWTRGDLASWKKFAPWQRQHHHRSRNMQIVQSKVTTPSQDASASPSPTRVSLKRFARHLEPAASPVPGARSSSSSRLTRASTRLSRCPSLAGSETTTWITRVTILSWNGREGKPLERLSTSLSTHTGPGSPRGWPWSLRMEPKPMLHISALRRPSVGCWLQLPAHFTATQFCKLLLNPTNLTLS